MVGVRHHGIVVVDDGALGLDFYGREFPESGHEAAVCGGAVHVRVDPAGDLVGGVAVFGTFEDEM